MLSLISTPIGNLQDITLRALETLKKVDYILCEDTRHSLKLLHHFGISKPLYSLHSHNEMRKSDLILEDLRSGKHVGLVCDAGTPGICDPSGILVKKCHEEGIPVIADCGASSVTAALSLYGLINPKFQFLGFCPKESKEKKDFLNKALDYDGISIFFDTPHQVEKTFISFMEIAPEKKICVIKELSKVHECLKSQTSKEWLSQLTSDPIKGELVVIIEGEKKSAELLDEEHIVMTLKKELDLPYNDLIRLASKLLKKPKNSLYQKWL